jgi:hypothetical protein
MYKFKRRMKRKFKNNYLNVKATGLILIIRSLPLTFEVFELNCGRFKMEID